MIFNKHIYSDQKKTFSVSGRIIWLSALFMGVLASISKIGDVHITTGELTVDSHIAFLFSLFVWYYNICCLKRNLNQYITARFFNYRLLLSLLLGTVLIVILVNIHQWLFPQYNLKAMMLMYQFRGLLINLTIYMFLYLLYQSHRNRLMELEMGKIKADNINAQFEMLKQQINPHFLFNSLNTLKIMVDAGDRHASDFIMKLSDFYRFTLENRKTNVIPLAEELNILEAYVYLLKARFEEGIQLRRNINAAHMSTFIPPFTLQLLVENCIKHNIVSLERPLQIKLYSTDDYLVVENSLQRKNGSEASTGIGLENIDQRYQHLISREIQIEAGNNLFTVKLPLIYKHQYHDN